MSKVNSKVKDIKICLLNTPTLFKKPLSRSMAGGLGFDGSKDMVLPPLDLAILAASLIKHDYSVTIIDADPLRLNDEQVVSNVSKGGYDAIIATVSLPTLDNDCAFIKTVRPLAPKVFVKTMIVEPNILKSVLQQSESDAVIFGECDLHIHDLISGKSTLGTAYVKEGRFKVETCDLIKDLDQLPLPALDLLPLDRYVYPLLGEKVVTMQTSRGCPFPCAYYCPYPLVEGNRWRKQSPDRVILEIEQIVRHHGIRKILFRDATFTLDKERTHQICDGIIDRNIDIIWWCETRVDCLDVMLLKKMKKAGCAGLNIGVETGDTEVLAAQAKKGLTIEKLQELRDAAKEIGVRLHFLLSKGFPKETKKSFVDTYELIMKLRPESLGITIMTPYPGTQLYKEALEKRWIESTKWEDFGGHQFVMHTDHLSREDFKIGFGFLQKAEGLLVKSRCGGQTDKVLQQQRQLYTQLLVWAADLDPLRQALAGYGTPHQGSVEASPNDHKNMARLSVIIPTYNRKDQLALCLDRLNNQDTADSAYEVIVVDDGSTDGTDQLVKNAATNYQLKYIRQDNGGPGSARNRGVHEAGTDIVTFIGDDILVTTGFVRQHLAAHKAHPREHEAILGQVDWPQDFDVTPFMKYIMGPSGAQFNFTEIRDYNNVGYNRFYTSNVSIKKSLLLKQDVIFDSDFTYAAMEDVELGYRLYQKGMRLIYHPDAMAYHNHPMDFASFLGRQEKVGAMTKVYEVKHPELATLRKELNGCEDTIVHNYCAQRNGLVQTVNELEQFCLPRLNKISINGTNSKDKFATEILEPIYGVMLQMALVYGYVKHDAPSPLPGFAAAISG